MMARKMKNTDSEANELDRARMDSDGLKKDKSKLEDELKSLMAFKRRLHEVEQENRKLAHDREELARAYKAQWAQIP